jgi:hypothetical protein
MTKQEREDLIAALLERHTLAEIEGQAKTMREDLAEVIEEASDARKRVRYYRWRSQAWDEAVTRKRDGGPVAPSPRTEGPSP